MTPQYEKGNAKIPENEKVRAYRVKQFDNQIKQVKEEITSYRLRHNANLKVIDKLTAENEKLKVNVTTLKNKAASLNKELEFQASVEIACNDLEVVTEAKEQLEKEVKILKKQLKEATKDLEEILTPEEPLEEELEDEA